MSSAYEPPVLTTGEALLVRAEECAVLMWQRSNYDCNATGFANLGDDLVVYAGYNVNASHEECAERHLPVGRTSEACFAYWHEGRSISRDEAVALAAVAC